MVEVIVLIFLFSFLVAVLMAVAVRLKTLTREIHQTNSLVVRLVAQDEPKKLEAAGDPNVLDFHTPGDEYASVTGRAQAAWRGQ